MLRMIANSSEPDLAQPKFWAPFVVVGDLKSSDGDLGRRRMARDMGIGTACENDG
jgi:hypothetical protein